MSEIIDKDMKIKAEYLIRVKNTEIPKFSNANKEYYSCWVEADNGKDERCLLFTEKEVEKFSFVITTKNYTFGRLEEFQLGNRIGYITKVFYKDLGEKLVFISKNIISSAENRANKNKEDLTKKSFLTDLLD